MRSKSLIKGLLLTASTVLLLGCGTETRALNAYRKGVAYFSDGRVDEALDLFNKALIDNPSLAIAHYYIGQCYLETNPAWTLVAEEEYKLALDMLNENPDQLANAGPEFEGVPLDHAKARILLGIGKASARRSLTYVNVRLDLSTGEKLLSSAVSHLESSARLDPGNQETSELVERYSSQLHRLSCYRRGMCTV